ncbi:MAG: hypothetical protein ACE5ES_04845 [Candidatus Nanoarchaeia archaeon]
MATEIGFFVDVANVQALNRVMPILRDMPTDELAEIVTDANEKRARGETNTEDPYLHTSGDVTRTMAVAAYRIVEEREGLTYALGLVGFRPAETFWEKVNHLFTGNYFPLAA